MLKALLPGSVFVLSVVFAAVPSAAQEVIHALTGTVTSINASAKTITVLQDNGATGEFKELSGSGTRVSFDKKIAGQSTAANAFQKQGSYVVVFYFGIDDNRTAVALKSLGEGPFQATVGTVTEVAAHSRSVSVRDQAGTVHTFTVDGQTVAEGNFGVEDGTKFHAQKGDQVRVVSTTINGNSTAVFIRDL